MYTEGARYNREKATVDIAKTIRKEIKKRFPKVKASVRSERFAGGTGINVSIKYAGFNPMNPKWKPNDWSTDLIANPRYSERGIRLLNKIKTLCQQYQMADSDSMTDYHHTNFYLSVKYDLDAERAYSKKLGIKRP